MSANDTIIPTGDSGKHRRKSRTRLALLIPKGVSIEAIADDHITMAEAMLIGAEALNFVFGGSSRRAILRNYPAGKLAAAYLFLWHRSVVESGTDKS